MVGSSVTAVGYGGAACNAVTTLLKDKPNEKFTEVFNKYILAQFDDLTSDKPIVGDLGQKKFAMASASFADGFSFQSLPNSGRGGNSLA